MLALVIASLATVSLFFTWFYSHRDEKNKRQQRLLLVGHLVAVLLIWAQYIQQLEADRDANARQRVQDEQHRELKNNSEAAARRHDEFARESNRKFADLVQQNEELKQQLAPVLEAARAKHPGIEESEAIQKLLDELDKLKPKLEFLSAKTRVETNVDGGPYKTTFFFQSRHPGPIRDARIRLMFDRPAKHVTVLAPGTLPFNDNLKALLTGKALMVTANILGDAGQLNVSLLSEQPLKIQAMETHP